MILKTCLIINTNTMKLLKSSYIFLLTCIVMVMSCKEDDDYSNLGNEPKSIMQIISERSDLSSLESAIDQAGLHDMLNSNTTYTVFAPTNAALEGINLESLSEDELQNFLLNHIITTTTADFTQSMTTGYRTSMGYGADGNNLSFFTNAEGDLVFNGMASIVNNGSNLGATNGIVHVVDGALAPPSLYHHIAANPNFSSFKTAIDEAGLDDFLSTVDMENENYPLTVLTPSNEAFESILAQLNGAFGWTSISDIPSEVITEIVSLHIISGINGTSADILGTSQNTLEGSSLSISAEGSIDDASYNNANITLENIQSTNGIMHETDKVLLTDNVFQSILSATLNIPERCNDKGFTTFLQAAEMTGLTPTLTNEELTAFVPNNDAFVGLFAITGNFESLEDFQSPEQIQLLQDLINYHLHAGILMASQLVDGEEITTLYDDVITADLSGNEPRLRPSFEEALPSIIVMTNIGTSNGIIHEINRVLVPANLVSALGIETSQGGVCPVGDPELVFFDWDANGPWWGNVNAENEAAHSLDGSSYGRANFQTGTTGWVDLFWRNGSTMNGQTTVGSNLNDYALKFDIKTIEPLTEGQFRIRFHDGDGVDAFYDWAPWNDSGEPFETDGWETIEIPLSVLGVPDFSLIDQEFGMAFDGADTFLNFAIDNMRFDTPGCGGTDPVDDPDLVFFDWDANGPWWGNVNAENQAAITLDGTNYGRANFQTGTTGWVDLFWRNSSTLNGQNIVADNINDYVLKFDIHVIEPISEGQFRIRFHDGDGVDAFYDWAPWNDTGEAFETGGNWVTITIPCSVLGVPDFSLIDQEFGMAFEGADILLNFAIDNVRFAAQ